TVIRPTTGPATAPPNGSPQLAKPNAVADSLCGNQLLTILLMVVASGPSAMPKNVRSVSSEPNPVASPVAPHSSDQTSIAPEKTFLPPHLSAAQPPMKLK